MFDSAWSLIGPLAGGVGLFLLGMGMMSDGLKLAAGPALHRILAGATRTRWHALGSGALVTAMVQSSSAVTVAVIGFINAGLLALSGAAKLVDAKGATRSLSVPAQSATTVHVRVAGNTEGTGILDATLEGAGHIDRLRHTWQVKPAGEVYTAAHTTWVE